MSNDERSRHFNNMFRIWSNAQLGSNGQNACFRSEAVYPDQLKSFQIFTKGVMISPHRRKSLPAHCTYTRTPWSYVPALNKAEKLLDSRSMLLFCLSWNVFLFHKGSSPSFEQASGGCNWADGYFLRVLRCAFHGLAPGQVCGIARR